MSLYLKSKGSAGSFRAAISINATEILDNSVADLVITSGGTPYNILYSSVVSEDVDHVLFANAVVDGITVHTACTRVHGSLWKKVVTLSAATGKTITIKNALNGSISTYYNYGSSSAVAFGDNGTQPFQVIGGLVSGQTEIFGLLADDGWSAKWNLGVGGPNRNISASAAGTLSVSYGDSSGGSTFSIVAGAPVSVSFFYFSCVNTQRDFQKYSQLYLAEAKGKTGDDIEKLAYATALSTIRTMNSNDQRVFMQPSYNYNPGQWMRDSFWTSIALNDGGISQSLLDNMKAATNWTTGQVPVFIADTNGGAGFWCEDEGTLLMIIWAFYLNKFFDVSDALTLTELNTLVSRIRSRIDSDGRFQSLSSSNPEADRLSLVDSYSTSATTVKTAYNQGMYAVAMRCALELNATGVTQTDVDNAANAYASMYNSTGGYFYFMRRGTSWVDKISPTDLIGEYYWIWLWNEPLLDTAMVAGQWSKLKSCANPYGFKYISNPDGSYCEVSEFITGGGICYKGHYQNGGTWIMADYCCHFVALLHNVESASAIRSSLDTRFSNELAISYNLHEYLAGQDNTGSDAGDAPVQTHVYGWNAKLSATYSTIYSYEPLLNVTVADFNLQGDAPGVTITRCVAIPTAEFVVYSLTPLVNFSRLLTTPTAESILMGNAPAVSIVAVSSGNTIRAPSGDISVGTWDGTQLQPVTIINI